MSRDYTKNIANYMDLPNADAALLDAPITAFSLWAKPRTLDTGGPNNFLFCIPNPGSGAPGWAAVLSSTTPSMQIRGRATSAETTRSSTGVTPFTMSQWTNFAGQTDWANDTHYLSTNGTIETFVTAGWTATAFDGGAGTLGTFRLGQTCPAAASLTTADAFDGLLAHVAFWTPTTLLTNAEFAALAQGVSPMMIRPGDLKLYRPLHGFDAQEPDYITHSLVTITGSVPAGSDGPPVQDIFEPNGSMIEALATTSIVPIIAQMMRRRMAA